jgi:asparagine synthase (glutamine-hydrolysing)
MCGIVGELSWGAGPDSRVVQRMTDRVAHRGPDGEGFFSRGPIAFGHRRLAIIDLSEAGREPMADVDGRCWIVFNGEIYNFRELRQELEADGARFASRSDTEVILEAYKRWDVECLARFNGMFAFALWDDRRERLWLARDRAGEKPLFYQPTPDGVVFASHLPALSASPQVSTRVSPSALGQLLALNYVVDPDCILEGVRTLEPAHFLVAERDRPLRTVRYWSLADAFRAKRKFQSSGEAAEALDALITDAVRLRLVSDVPLGGFLSGGIDSSAVASAMTRCVPAAQTRTFSVGFQEASYDELPEARAAALAIGVDHRDRLVRADMAAALPGIVQAAGEPLADTSAVPMYYLAAFARETVTVCLSGDGGDENFAGYETYRADALQRATKWVPRWLTRSLARASDSLVPVTFDKVSLDFKLRQFLRGQPLAPERAHYTWREIFGRSETCTLLRPDARATVLASDPFDAFGRHWAEVPDLSPLDRALYVDVKTWLASDILAKVDRMTMAHALESRAPFLDHRVMEFAASLAPDLKLRGSTTKYILKASQRRHLPSSIVDRSKAGFNAPVSHWFAGPLYDLGRAATAPGVLGEWFEPAAIDRLWTEHRARRHDHGLKLFGLTCFGLWRTQQAAPR